MSDLYASVRYANGRYEFSCPSLSLIVRAPHAEWVLEAAAEVIAQAEKLRMEGVVEELAMLQEFGDAPGVEVDAAKYDCAARFEAVPQCIVSMGDNDYRWISPVGRRGGERSMTRLFDMSLTRNDSFLVDQPQE